MFKEFKKFVLRGNVVDLAVAVVIGTAFTGLVNSFVKDFLSPLLGAIQGKVDLTKHTFVIHHIPFYYGDFLSTAITFLLTAAVVFFLVVQPINHLLERTRRKGPTPDPTTRQCPECLGEIPLKARRCMYCTSRVKPETDKA